MRNLGSVAFGGDGMCKLVSLGCLGSFGDGDGGMMMRIMMG